MNKFFPMPHAQCPMPHAPCPMPNASCPMPNAQCPMPLFTPSLALDLNRWTFKNIMKVYLSLLVFNS
ncbi:hypothetical protein [Nostoc sp.]|uniref:hypothetical protein n=1 Tax=Nostoc sp. TaxID=1180 RepID=UPI002FFD228C